MVPRNVCGVVDKPRHEKKEIHPLSPEQARELLVEAESDRLHALYVVGIATGMRQGEMLALHWENVDLDAGTISVIHSLRFKKGKPVLGPPKSKKGRRLIRLPEFAITALWEHKRKMLAEGHAALPWVFCHPKRRPLRGNNVTQNSFKPLLKRAGLPNICFHDLRHTAATLLLLMEVHPKIVQEMLGHATIAMTLDTYSHVLPSMQDDAASKMDQLFRIDVA